MKSPYADIILRDPLRATINSPDDEKLHKLYKISDLIEQMGKKCCREGGKKVSKREKYLTKITAYAFAHTCRGLIAISKYLLTHKDYQYVMLGKFTSDHIEKEFGKLRQGSGGTYYHGVLNSLLYNKFLRRWPFQKQNCFYVWIQILRSSSLQRQVINVKNVASY